MHPQPVVLGDHRAFGVVVSSADVSQFHFVDGGIEGAPAEIRKRFDIPWADFRN
ncbi:hypothetical protein D3C76_1597130 [compost metagenome]